MSEFNDVISTVFPDWGFTLGNITDSTSSSQSSTATTATDSTTQSIAATNPDKSTVKANTKKNSKLY